MNICVIVKGCESTVVEVGMGKTKDKNWDLESQSRKGFRKRSG